jgi:DNA-3-methyladenine glycosylase I
MQRCEWPKTEKEVRYHDTEWGVPLHNDRKLFEFIVLDTFQSGLSWRLMLEKREGFRKAFANFDPKKVATYTERDVKRLLNDAGIIRNRQKITATIKNARAFLAAQKEFGTFAKYIWQFTDGKTINHKLRSEADYQATSPQAEAMSKDMKQRGFAFVGPTTCHAYMQGIGMYNDHLVSCFRHKEVGKQ